MTISKIKKKKEAILPRHCFNLSTDVIDTVIDYKAKQHWGGEGERVWQWLSQFKRNVVKVNHEGGVATAKKLTPGC